MKIGDISETEKDMILSRESVLGKIQDIFKTKALEAHVFGSVARNEADAYSDLDIWLTFSDENFEQVKQQRFEYYKQIGEVLNICEPPQNAPLGGICSALLIKLNEVILVIDIYLCPISTSFITKESKKLFGINLPSGEISGYNPQKIQVSDDYRINFFIGFVFNTIKKLKRNEKAPLDAVIDQYNKLSTNYNIPVELLDFGDQNLTTLGKIIENTKKIANERQEKTLEVILNFGRKLF